MNFDLIIVYIQVQKHIMLSSLICFITFSKCFIRDRSLVEWQLALTSPHFLLHYPLHMYRTVYILLDYLSSQVYWFKDGKQISKRNEHCKMRREGDGTCSLHISSTTSDDDGNYTIMAANPQVEMQGPALCCALREAQWGHWE